MFSISVNDFTLICHTGSMPEFSVDYSQHARLVEQFDSDSSQGVNCLLAVKRGLDWPFLVVMQKCKLPGIFGPCALIVPETEMLFIGVNERLLAYNLAIPARIWEDSTDCGVLGWARHGNHVILSAELELAAWSIDGRKLWATFVEPPWNYTVIDGLVHLDVMGNISSFVLEEGPKNVIR